MQIVPMVTAAALSALAALAEDRPVAPDETITVCTELASSRSAQPALAVASGILADAGVIIDWQPKPSACTPGGITITTTRSMAADFPPGALAYALPFKRNHICIFYDRLERYDNVLRPRLLGHVIAHEITHVLQGLRRHSPGGLMKADWTSADLYRMRHENLPLASEDIERIHLGVLARARMRPHS